MTTTPDSTITLEITRVFLDEENPRHKPFQSQDEVIRYLCETEKVLPLAKDIADHGLNPLERFAVLPSGDTAYVTAEGNRRLCALKLLHDPDLAPAALRRDFEALSQSGRVPSTISAFVFPDRASVDLWLDRIHAGSNEGRGRRPWTAEQKARHSGYDKNVRAQRLLDAAEHYGLLDNKERKGRLSTVQRYLQNPDFRQTLGLDVTDAENPATTLTETDFTSRLRLFVRDVVDKTVTTRDNVPRIREYASHLTTRCPLSVSEGPSRPIDPSAPVRPRGSTKKPQRPRTPKRLPFSKAFESALESLPSYKLQRLYYSLCSISLNTHTSLLTVGAWTLLESLTALDGRNPNTDFHAYLSQNRLSSLGLGSRREVQGIRAAVKRISDLGNNTKHDATAASFNGETLANDMETIGGMLLALAESARQKRVAA